MIKSLKKVYAIGISIRIFLLILGIIMDNHFHISYTDIDYKVFTDGAKYVTMGQSPFNRHTYRYTPLMAYFVVPNHYISPHYGKIMFIIFDIVAALLIQSLLNKVQYKEKVDMIMLWFLNPLTIQLSTRGSSDIIVTVLMLLTIYFLNQKTNLSFVLSAILYGITVHFKIYPIIFCFVLYLNVKENRNFINLKSILYGLISGGVFIFVTALFYLIYGYEYLYEGYLYHLIRKDHRHNFSIQFLFIYLSFENIDKILSFLLFLPQVILIIYGTIRLYKNLYLSLFILSYIFVAYNKVMTAQYFVWFLQFLPLFFYQTQIYQQRKICKGLLIVLVWFGLILIWNNLAFRFEAQGQDVFLGFHIVNTLFFIVNIWIMGEMLDIDKRFKQQTIEKEKVKNN